MGASGKSHGQLLSAYLQKEWDALGTTRGAWCRQAGLPDSTVLRWAQGIEPDLRNLRLVAAACRITLPQLLVICGYTTEAETKMKAPPPRERPTIAEAIELDTTISEQERAALRGLHEMFQQAAAGDGHKKVTGRLRGPKTS